MRTYHGEISVDSSPSVAAGTEGDPDESGWVRDSLIAYEEKDPSPPASPYPLPWERAVINCGAVNANVETRGHAFSACPDTRRRSFYGYHPGGNPGAIPAVYFKAVQWSCHGFRILRQRTSTSRGPQHRRSALLT